MPVIRPDVEVSSHNIYVRRGGPLRAGMQAVGISERHMYTGNLFILQNVADDVLAGQICSDRELADAVAVFITMRVFPKIAL